MALLYMRWNCIWWNWLNIKTPPSAIYSNMKWFGQMLTSLAMIDSTLTREDALRVSAAYCPDSSASRSQCQPQQFDLDLAGEPRAFLTRCLQALLPSLPLPLLLVCTELGRYFTLRLLASGWLLYLHWDDYGSGVFGKQWMQLHFDLESFQMIYTYAAGGFKLF